MSLSESIGEGENFPTPSEQITGFFPKLLIALFGFDTMSEWLCDAHCSDFTSDSSLSNLRESFLFVPWCRGAKAILPKV